MIELTADEQRLACLIGAERRRQGLLKGRPEPYGTPTGDLMMSDVCSSRAEMLVAKQLDLPWTALHERPQLLLADVGEHNLQVRSTPLPHGRLIVHGEDAPGDPFVLVVDSLARPRLAGWIEAAEAQQRCHWEDPGTGRPAYFVPQGLLRPIAGLRERLGDTTGFRPQVSAADLGLLAGQALLDRCVSVDELARIEVDKRHHVHVRLTPAALALCALVGAELAWRRLAGDQARTRDCDVSALAGDLAVAIVRGRPWEPFAEGDAIARRPRDGGWLTAGPDEPRRANYVWCLPRLPEVLLRGYCSATQLMAPDNWRADKKAYYAAQLRAIVPRPQAVEIALGPQLSVLRALELLQRAVPAVA